MYQVGKRNKGKVDQTKEHTGHESYFTRFNYRK